MSAIVGLKGVSPTVFLKKNWQKKPLFMRGVFSSLDFFTPEVLIGLAGDPTLTSRIVTKRSSKDWSLAQGPFSASSFKRRGSKDWTLLVQEVNHRLPKAQELLQAYSFIPDWRLDDLMVSLAVPGGSVGPHTDNYDVFLIQAWGTRRWEIATEFDASLLPNIDLKVLSHFSGQKSWVARPGDVLYLPPGVAHYGVALEDCATLSVGFRAPSVVNLIDAAFSAIPGEGPLLVDRDRDPCRSPGEVSSNDFSKMGEHLSALFSQEEVRMAVVDSLTVPRRESASPREIYHWTPAKIKKVLSPNSKIMKDPQHRMAYFESKSGLYVAIDGHGVLVSEKRAVQLYKLIARSNVFPGHELAPFMSTKSSAQVVCELFSIGLLRNS